MIDINLIRDNPDLVRENIKKKFQDKKLPLVDEVIALDAEKRTLQREGDERRARRNTLSKSIGALMKEGKKDESEKVKQEVKENNDRIAVIEARASEIDAQLKKDMMAIPNIIADDVPIGKDDSQNVQWNTYLEAKEKPFDVPYHVDILERLGGVDLDSARRTSGNGWHYVSVNGKEGYMSSKFLSAYNVSYTKPVKSFTATLKNINGGSVVNFRLYPGMKTKIIGVYPVGTKVTVLEMGDNWSKVEIDGKTGYVSTYFLKY